MCKQKKQQRCIDRLQQSLWSAARHHQYLSVHLGNCSSNLTLACCIAWGPFDSVILRASLSIFRSLQLDQTPRQLLCSQQTNLDWHVSSLFIFLPLLLAHFFWQDLAQHLIDYAGGRKPYLSLPRHLYCWSRRCMFVLVSLQDVSKQ